MARVAVESQAAAAVQGPTENQVQDVAVLLVLICGGLAVANPGVLLGAAVAAGWQWLHRPSLARRIVFALVIAAPLLAVHPFIVWGWPWHNMVVHDLPFKVPLVDKATATRSLAAEALLGPLWIEAVVLAARLRGRTVGAQVRRDHRADQRRWRAISGHRRKPMVPDPHTRSSDLSPAHPPGKIRLGVDAEMARPLDLELPGDLAAHTFLPGASGSGKTTTVIRLADGALADGYGVVIVDAKAGGLGDAARRLADRYGVPFYLVDPDDPDSLGYNPCTGDGPAVANKIVGAFSYGPSAEIYKSIALEAVPLVVRGLQDSGQDVNLASLHRAFGPRGMERIARELPEDSETRRRLNELADRSTDRAGSGGRGGLRYRLGALLEGKFGELFRDDDALDWDEALAEPSVVYVALSALASSEDVELMGRVLAQDLKQVCAARLRDIADGADPVPVLAVWDEFAALREAEQLTDLLLQARQALMPTVISTQYLPETTGLRKACLGAGLLLVHRVEAEDAEAIAKQFGTRRGTEVTHQTDYATGYSEKGSIRRVEQYTVHPNELRNFAVGQIAFKSVPQRRYGIVQVYRDTD